MDFLGEVRLNSENKPLHQVSHSLEKSLNFKGSDLEKSLNFIFLEKSLNFCASP